MDGGAGTDEQLSWLLARDYHVMAKGMSNYRSGHLAARAERWDPWRDVWVAEVPPPIDYGRPVRAFVKRQCKHGKWRHSHYLTTLSLPSKRHFMTFYHQRGGAEVEQFREDKSGLALAARRKQSFTGQQGYLLLTDLAHNLLADFVRRGLCRSPFADYGLKRIVRDILNVPGQLIFEGNRLREVRLLTQTKNVQNLIICLERYNSSE
jgi:hypothetical protein